MNLAFLHKTKWKFVSTVRYFVVREMPQSGVQSDLLFTSICWFAMNIWPEWLVLLFVIKIIVCPMVLCSTTALQPVLFGQMTKRFLQKLQYSTNCAQIMTLTFCSSTVKSLWFPYHWVSNLPLNLPASRSLVVSTCIEIKFYPFHFVPWPLERIWHWPQWWDVTQGHDVSLLNGTCSSCSLFEFGEHVESIMASGGKQIQTSSHDIQKNIELLYGNCTCHPAAQHNPIHLAKISDVGVRRTNHLHPVTTSRKF